MKSPVLVIRKGGIYTGAYKRIIIAATDGKPVIIDRATLTGPGDLITQNVACDLTVRNTTGSTNPPFKLLVVWRFTRLTVEHNLLNGTGGILICDHGHSAKFASVCYNRGNNITGATGPETREKVSFIQFQNVHCPNIRVQWNQLENRRGESATEDAISLLRSGGTPDAPADISNNLVHGVFEWPMITGTGHGNFSGSGIMCFDPGESYQVTDGGYARIHDNQVIACENQAYAMAGGHHIEVDHNRAVNDGTTTRCITVAYQAWNWHARTPGSLFGAATGFHDNQSYWVGPAGLSNFSIDAPVATDRNTIMYTTEADEVRLWQAKCAHAKVCLGPTPAR